MKLQKLLSYTRQAVDEYEMIQEGDKIAIGISGGKDSLTLLYALTNLQKFYPKQFDLIAITVDLGYEGFDLSKIKQLCNDLGVEYHIVSTKIGEMVTGDTLEGSACSLCARLRKGALNDAAKELGCNKVAYGHHMDDVIETMMLALVYEGRFCSFWPVTFLDKTELTVIRPMIYIPEAEVKGFEHKYHLPIAKNPCPIDGSTKREYIKSLIRQLNTDNPGVKKRLFHAIKDGNLEGWSR
ncbi:MAG: ATP-binding protein [Lachnospiraceae bacterium]|nr:tRNA 2-thiocytidine(32) synthetase TtcA [Lachnospiraceae bacterium]MEE1015887.1 ATP-binding protein [Lachnospiraceae bacterium]